MEVGETLIVVVGKAKGVGVGGGMAGEKRLVMNTDTDAMSLENHPIHILLHICMWQALVHDLRRIWMKITKDFVSDFEKLISNQLVSESYPHYSHIQ